MSEESDPRPASAESRRFFVVWSPQGGPPVARMATFAQARSAAARLALKNPERDVFVLQSCWGKQGEPAAADGQEVAPPGPGARP